MNAFIMINTEPGKLWRIAEEAINIEGVNIAQAVTGQWDVIIYVEFKKMEELSNIIHEIQSINGVIRTSTAVAMAHRIY